MVRDDEVEELDYTVGAAMGCAMMIGLVAATLIAAFVLWYLIVELVLIAG